MKRVTTSELFEEYKQGNLKARDEIFDRYKVNIEEIAKKYYGLGLDNEIVCAYAYEGFCIYLENCANTEKGLINLYANYKTAVNTYLSIIVLKAKTRTNSIFNKGRISECSLDLLFQKYKQGDIEARDEIFERYKTVATEIAESYFDLGVENEDVLEYAYEILLTLIYHYKDREDVQRFVRDWKEAFETRLINFILKDLNLSSASIKKADLINFLKSKRTLIGELKDIFTDCEPAEESRISELEILPTDQELVEATGLRLMEIQDINNLLLRVEETRLFNSENEVIYNILRQQLSEIIKNAHLTERQMEYFRLMFLEDKSSKEIESIFGVSQPAVVSMKKYFISKIKEKHLGYFMDLAQAKDSLEDTSDLDEFDDSIEDESILTLESK